MKANSLTYLFTSFAAKHRDNLDKLMKEIGLHGGQIFVLNCLWNNNFQSQAELVKQLNVSAPTVFNMVVRLSDAGFVKVIKDETDARTTRVCLTEKGEQIKFRVFEQWQKLENNTFGNLSEPEKLMLTMLLQKITER